MDSWKRLKLLADFTRQRLPPFKANRVEMEQPRMLVDCATQMKKQTPYTSKESDSTVGYFHAIKGISLCCLLPTLLHTIPKTFVLS